jgi:hypothetical protein
MLSLGKPIDKNSKPIAFVCDGEHDGELIFITQKNIDATRQEKKQLGGSIDLSNVRDVKKLHDEYYKRWGANKKITNEELNTLNSALKSKTPPATERLHKLYQIASELKTEAGQSKIIIFDGHVRMLPKICKGTVFRLYAAGPSQSGKSTHVSGVIEMYKKLEPKNRLFVFSDTEKDEKLDKHDPIRIKLDEELADANSADFANSLCVFDDVDSIKDAKIKKSVLTLRDNLLQKGRHDNIALICTNHLLTDYKNTRVLLNESQYITLFPASTTKHSFNRVLKTYFGMSQELIDYLYNCGERSITLFKEFPQFYITNTEVGLIS